MKSFVLFSIIISSISARPFSDYPLYDIDDEDFDRSPSYQAIFQTKKQKQEKLIQQNLANVPPTPPGWKAFDEPPPNAP